MRPLPVLLSGALAFAALCWWCVTRHGERAVGAAVVSTAPPAAGAPAVPHGTPPVPVTPPAGDSMPVETQRVTAAIDATLQGRTIEFETASAIITPRGRAVLDSLVPLLARVPAQRFEIGGHTDARGNAAANQALSAARATAVRRYLAAQGIERTRLVPRGYGATKPLTADTTAEALQRNRRIEFTPLPER